jgi:hypothetical protein
MSSSGRSLTVTMPATGVSHCPDDEGWVCCLGCGEHLGLVQPVSEEPERLVGTCDNCGRWYLLDWHCGSVEGVMLLLPGHAELLLTFSGKAG